MYLPDTQSIIAAGLALTGTITKRLLPSRHCLSILLMRFPAETVSSGKILDYAVEKCIDSDGNQRCSKPFLVARDTCYQVEWSTEGALSHTTVEVRDARSDEIVYYRDTNGEWTAEKNEVSADACGDEGTGCANGGSWCTSISSRGSGSMATRRLNIRLRRVSEKLGWMAGCAGPVYDLEMS